eukprot:4644779-Alexandrium_andersonii.AAC.1
MQRKTVLQLLEGVLGAPLGCRSGLLRCQCCGELTRERAVGYLDDLSCSCLGLPRPRDAYSSDLSCSCCCL